MGRTPSIAVALAVLASAIPSQRFAGRGKDKPAQPSDENAVDWDVEVNRACTARRYGLRLAASRKVASVGDLAVPALLAWVDKNGKNAIPSELINAIADAGTTGPQTFAMLEGWANDRDFYWRAQALRGLAERKRPEDRARFLAAIQDRSFLVRMFAAKGLLQLGDPSDRHLVATQLLEDPDPRVAPAIAGMLLDQGHGVGLDCLISALTCEHTFLGDPWGVRVAADAARALERHLKADVGEAGLGFVPGAPAGDPASGIAVAQRVIGLLADRGIDVAQPTVTPDPGAGAIGGVEIRSCRNGDMFLRWDANGQLFLGLDGNPGPSIGTSEGKSWPEVRQFLDREQAMGTYGVVICDFARIADSKATTQVKAAPESLPQDLLSGLKGMASVLEDSGSKELAEALRERLRQFAPADRK